MHRDFARCYRALELVPGSDWKTVQAAYRSLVRKWHPDRLGEDASQHNLAEEKIKEINAAFRALQQYYRKHGTTPSITPEQKPLENIPPQDPTNERYTAPRNTNWEPTHAAPSGPALAKEPPHKHGKRATLGAIFTGAIVLSVFLLLDEVPPQSADTDSANIEDVVETAVQEPTSNATADNGARFTIGSTIGEVYEAQGIPAHTDKDVWHYGKSTVHFTNGMVSSWENHPDSPLRVSGTSVVNVNHATLVQSGFTKEQVRAIQGIPTQESEAVWEYGSSKIYFKNNRVTSWHESPRNPLKVAD